MNPSLFDLANQDLPPSWATSSSDGGSASSAKSADDDERELRKSVDVLMMKRSAALDSDSLQSGEDLFSKEMGPDQIGAFVRIGDDGMRSRACNFVVSLLKQKIEDRDEAFLSKCVLTIVRLSIESTFSFVREAFQELTDLLRAAQIPNVVVPAETPVVTRWIKREELPSVQEGTNELTKLLLRNIDIMEGRIPHVIVPMAWHPTFLEKWYRTMMHLMRGTGPLLFTWRRYISIVACARFQCMPMLKLQEMDFLACGGDPSWLQGVSAPSLPPKLYALLELNGLLAHQPWKITHSTIEALLSSSIESQWSVGELVHAIAIMVTFHSVSALVWGLGVTPEVDISEALKSETETETAPVPSVPQGSGDTKSVIDILKKGPETFSKERQNWMEAGETTKSNIWAEAEDGAEVSQLLQQQSLSGATSHQQYCARYVGPFVLEYADFEIGNGNAIFYKAQYNWENDGYALVHQVLDGLAPLLGAELQHIQSLTYHRFANVEGNLDTTAFREAVWHYTHRIKGLLDDDYNYKEVNQLLNRQMKFYIKKISCLPQTITNTDFVNLSFDLQPSEKVHIALLAIEAAKEASLSYALKALSQYLKRRDRN